ncbi:muramoyltetrapeptide carboxypeptidase [Devosia yakushimensis]|uniref:Muramoyltetrapeptide carboxypeptidase n=1 Tax=Devosia yakushimensis TaxID=470028 RepID=A0ABQ5UDX2_9HYPH|nr:muramoyltetrapeptide carboxypeptidase [Devosia yakushimensis]
MEKTVELLEQAGFRVDLGKHVLDRHGYLAGRDEDRISDLNDAFVDSEVRAIIATRGGKGAYRIADALDFAAAHNDPKLVVGFSEITIIQLALWQHANIPSLHGTPSAFYDGLLSETTYRACLTALSSGEPLHLRSMEDVPTSSLTTSGRAEGILVGGNLDMIVTGADWLIPKLNGNILFIEDVKKAGLGHIDRQMTRLLKSGYLENIAGIAVGQFTNFDTTDGWSVVDVLRDRLALIDVPILGGLPLGHGRDALVIPIGTHAVIDADEGTLTVEAAVR